MTTANTNTNTMTSVLPPEFKADPVMWAKKGNKIVFGNVADLAPDPTLNIRHRAGTQVYGVTVDKDTYDIPGMKAGIVEMVGIQEPILVSVREMLDAERKKIQVFVPLRGNRRTFAGQELLSDGTINPELRDALTKRTPMILMHGLTPEQEAELIQDQTQKPFLRSEVIKHIFRLRQNKWTFERIAMQMWETLGRFSGNAKKIAEVREITDPVAKREKVKTWLRGTLDNYIIWGYDLGEFVRKAIILSEMAVDGVKTQPEEKPYFVATKDSQKRIAALKKAKEADGSKWNGTLPVEGSEFKKKLDEYHAADYGTKPVVEKAAGPKMMQRKDLEGIKDSFASQAVRGMIDRVLGETVPHLTAVDEFAGQMETKSLAVENYLPKLKPEVAAIMRLVFLNPDPTDFVTFLESNCVVEDTKPAEETENEEFNLVDANATATDDGNTTPAAE